MLRSIKTSLKLDSRPKFVRKGDRELRVTLLKQLLGKTKDSVTIMYAAIHSYRDPLLYLIESDPNYAEIISQDLIHQAFAYFSTIYTKMKSFAKNLEERFEEDPYLVIQDVIADFFQDHRLLKAYMDHAEDNAKARAILNGLMKKHKILRDFVKKTASQTVHNLSETRKLDFISVLWYPRVVMLEYLNLLSYLEARTPVKHADKDVLKKIMVEIELLIRATSPTQDELDALQRIKSLAY